MGWTPKYSTADSVADYVDWLYAQDNVEDILNYAQQTMKKLNVVRQTA
jgi:dTDP-L-rhamnose 4-epimerase